MRERVEARIRSITSLRDRSQHAQEDLAAARADLQTLNGRLASLQALQQAARGEGDKAVERWLGEQDLGTAKRLLETLEVSDKWQKAAEVVLAGQLQAVMVQDLARPASDMARLERGKSTLFETNADPISARAGTLAPFVRGPGQLTHLLNSIHLPKSRRGTAAARRLAPGECRGPPRACESGVPG